MSRSDGSTGRVTRRRFAQWAATGALATLTRSQAAEPRPNVLLLITDDQGYSDFGFTGNPVVRTPRIDRLASESAVFRNFVVCPACSPSRAALYTGREHLSTGVWGVPPRANLQRDETLLPAWFQHAGYRTLHLGKADTTRVLELQPWHRGWDDAVVIDGGYVHRDPPLNSRAGVQTVPGWSCDLLTDRALEFVQGAGPQPWLLTAAYIIPHLPWVCDERCSAPFRQQGLSPQLAACYGSLAQLDAAIGRLLDGLAAAGQAERTIVALVSDNGMTDQDPASQPLSPEDWRIRNPAGLRGHKATVWENGIRVPMLVRWPGRVTPGDRPQFGSAEDVLPTLLDLAGIAPDSQPHQPLAGRSLRPALEQASSVDDHPAVLRLGIAGPGSPRATAGIIPDPRALRLEDHHLCLRGPRWKLHALPGGQVALYDILADPTESQDQHEAQPAVTAALLADLRQRWDALLASGRAFAMPTIRLFAGVETGRRPGQNLLPAAMAQQLSGRVRVVGQTAVGFAAAGDSASYALDCRDPGRYQVMLRGTALDQCAPLTVQVGQAVQQPVSSAATAISCGVVTVPRGPLTLTVRAGGTAPAAVATLKDIALTWVPPK
ncbi:MAG: sulfatase-like hydrolase/transferase [Fimbriimonadaceae bacterium]|nr:sulfatase-like hydrolase/transferase [Fimbriimonadaceae bacterium]